MAQNHRNKSVNVHQFAMVPRAEIPRASFNMQKAYKTTFDTGWLVPIFCEEVLPGDTFRVKMTAFARLATPIFPIMDNLYLESFFFFVPNRLVWDNWKRFMGEQDAPNDSIAFTVPKVPISLHPAGSIYDYFGLPGAGQIVSGLYYATAFPLRGYNLIFNEWFRDENLMQPAVRNSDDGPDLATDYVLRRRGKRHDYFTSCLPWPQKGNSSVPLPIGGFAPVVTQGTNHGAGVAHLAVNMFDQTGAPLGAGSLGVFGAGMNWNAGAGTGTASAIPGNLYADLSQATAATINQLRQSFQIQKLLERDARGGTRYTEIVRSHFGVISPDARLQRPEYLGGGRAPISISPVTQTSSTDATSPLGNQAAVGTMLAHGHGFSQSFTEHGYVIGIINVRADLTYQQGVRRHWIRSTRYDYYFPAFAMLGEQVVLKREIYATGLAPDGEAFGYQERWAEYRYSPSEITGLFRSTAAGTLDAWHLSQNFGAAPVLGQTFIEENPPMERVLAVGAAAGGAQLIFDSFFDMKVARPMPLYSVPGLIDHF